MDDFEIAEIIERIIKNTRIIQTMYQDCIDLSKNSFEQVERNFIVKLLKEIDEKLQEYILTKEIDFHKDVRGHYYQVIHICRYDEWPEWKEYKKYINDPHIDGNINICKFIRNSLRKYKFPTEYIFDYYDNGWLRYKVADFIASGNKTIGNEYEDYV